MYLPFLLCRGYVAANAAAKEEDAPPPSFGPFQISCVLPSPKLTAMAVSTFSITCSADVPPEVDGGWCYLWVTVLDWCYWVAGAAVLLHEFLSGRELFGCGIMLCAVILVQLPEGFWKRKIKTNNE
mgnify:CR=1 FL=1